MKKHFLFVLVLSISTLFYACSASSDEILPETLVKELKLTLPEDSHGIIETDQLELALEVIEGNGDYQVTISETDGDPDAIAEVQGNKIKLSLLTKNLIEVTVTDKKSKAVTFKVLSSHKSLEFPSFGLLLSQGESFLMDNIQFGAGAPYTIEVVRGNASIAKMEQGGIHVVANKLGNTYYKVRDKRGVVARLEVSTILNVDLTSNIIELEALNTMSITVNLPKRTDWVVIGSTDKVTEKVNLVRPLDPSTNNVVDFQVLMINTSDTAKGSDTITLKNKDNELAVVRVLVR